MNTNVVNTIMDMEQDDFAIGVSQFSDKVTKKNNWFKLNPGDNIYRILPPMFSLAATGKYAMYWAFHGGFRRSSGSMILFRCVEKRHGSEIIQTCPVCEETEKLITQYQQLKQAAAAKQISEEKVKQFWKEYIFPIKAQRVVALNVMTPNHEVGFITVPYKAFQAIESCLRDAATKLGIDPTGIEGAFINIKKIQPYAGSPQVNYSAELVMETDGKGNFTIKKHLLTSELIQNNIRHNARDLKYLFRDINREDLAMLIQTPPEERPIFVDRLISQAETTNGESTSPFTIPVPNTEAKLVGRPQITSTGQFEVKMPQMPKSEAEMVNNTSSQKLSPDLQELLAKLK